MIARIICVIGTISGAGLLVPFSFDVLEHFHGI